MSDYLDLVAAARAADPKLSASSAHALVQCSEQGFAAYSAHLSAKGITSTSATRGIQMPMRGTAVDEYLALVKRHRLAGLGARDAHRAVLNTSEGSDAYRCHLTRLGVIAGNETL